MNNNPTREVDRWQWHKELECVVEILKTGRFPTTVIVRLPDGKEVETDYCNLLRKGIAE